MYQITKYNVCWSS